ncbi:MULTISPECIES: hypothetical protein [Yersinia]|uniref:Uncharacterized protein n=1 Tax=Yersinia pekkanenii TaxID=1288385 RepID=A0A0T9RPS0_9GAMM|nr:MULTISPECIES: hypothetical protein [Yersinia]CNI75997.1 Uncharacterised protein [Yersinia pekkanenii]CRY69601.1 Uncharacterised protein [Yersinia pekkanenii]SUQ17626.1 Uncharacterised protein [Yersinia pseudotuberculosis]
MAYEQFVQVIMPSVFCPEDGKWIQEMLQQFTASARHKIVALYADVYQAAWNEEPVSFKRENRARHEANARLRMFVTQHVRSAAGLTEKPPLVGKS